MKVRNLLIYILVTAIILVGAYATIFGLTFGRVTFNPLEAVSYGQELAGGSTVLFKLADPGKDVEPDYEAIPAIVSIMEKRLNVLGYDAATVMQEGKDGIRVNLPINKTSPMKDASQVAGFLSAQALLEFKDADGNVIAKNQHIKEVRSIQDTSGYVIWVKFTKEGALLMQDATKAIIEAHPEATDTAGRTLTIAFDGEQLAQVTLSQEPMTEDTFGFNPGFAEAGATNFVNLINNGAYTSAVDAKEQKDTSATMGAKAKNALWLCLAGAALLVALYFVLTQRFAGITACISIVFFSAGTIFCVSLFRTSISAASFAAMLIGLLYLFYALNKVNTVMREEYNAGKNLRAAYKSAYSGAKSFVHDGLVVLGLVFLAFVMGTAAGLKSFSYFLGISVGIAYISVYVIHWFMMRMAVLAAPERAGLFFKANKGGQA